MKKNFLGQTGIEVTELCFGALPMGPLQAKLSLDEGANLLLTALNKGINFVDTAEMYQNYNQLRGALNRVNGEVILATKSTAETYEGMEKSIVTSLSELGREYIDIFHLHAPNATAEVFNQRKGALKCLMDYKRKGIVRAIGISTHSIKTVEASAGIEEIEVVFPIINILGMGIIDGGPNEMIKAIKKVHDAGKGIYGMKALAGGNLIYRLEEALNYVRAIEGMASVAVGMVSKKEIDLNVKLFKGEQIDPDLWPKRDGVEKKLFISRFCKGCGTCVDVCPNGALFLNEGKAVVKHELCLLCGYCNPVCPEFALRML